MARDVFPGHEEPVTSDGEPDPALEVLLGDEVSPGADDLVEPVLDE